MRISKIVLLFAFVLFFSGCVTWRDVQGNEATKEVEAACKHKCSYYENNQGTYTYKVCFTECMRAKGFDKTVTVLP